MTNKAVAICVSCARGTRTFAGRYRDFLRDPGTLFTLASFILLIAAILQDPAGLNEASQAGSPLYFTAALVGSLYIWWSAIQGIRAGDFTADIPVSLATIAAIAIGQYSAASVVAVLLLVGGLLEEFVSARAFPARAALARLLPDHVTVRRDGHDRVVAIEAVVPDDILLERSGERLPVDGVVALGSASVNQAAITGESLPVEKQAGDEVYAGRSTNWARWRYGRPRSANRRRWARSAAWSQKRKSKKRPSSASSTSTPNYTPRPRFCSGCWCGGGAAPSCGRSRS